MHQLSIRKLLLMFPCLLLLVAACWCSPAPWLLASRASPAPTKQPAHTERAVFAAGCFWKVQYVFGRVPGVIRTSVGYTGGSLKDPSYEKVCTDKTGHAEAVLVEFDPAKTSYPKLLEVFFANHDPTTSNRQGPDFGSQYRSGIFYTTPQQKDLALAYKRKLEMTHRFRNPIVTSVEPAGQFYKAEEYHQDYYAKHGAVCF